jgi:hypothetical protein
MSYSLTDSLDRERFCVVDVDKQARRLRVRGLADACTDFSCEGADIITEEGVSKDLDMLRPGDIIKMGQKDGRAHEIVVVRRAYEEYSSPEW